MSFKNYKKINYLPSQFTPGSVFKTICVSDLKSIFTKSLEIFVIFINFQMLSSNYYSFKFDCSY